MCTVLIVMENHRKKLRKIKSWKIFSKHSWKTFFQKVMEMVRMVSKVMNFSSCGAKCQLYIRGSSSENPTIFAMAIYKFINYDLHKCSDLFSYLLIHVMWNIGEQNISNRTDGFHYLYWDNDIDQMVMI